MKKFLLSLLTVFAATPSFAKTDLLTAEKFESPTSYSKKDYVSEDSKVSYHAYFMTSSGNMQMNNKNDYSIYSSSNPDNKVIKSITVNYASGANSVIVECDTEPYTEYSHTASHGTALDEITGTAVISVDPTKQYKYFHLYSKKGALYLDSVAIEYEDEKDPREYVTLSFPEKVYEAFLGEGFYAPQLNSSVEGAKAAVVYTSSDESVATVDNQGNITILDDGATTITASIPEENETYYGAPASYDLVVKDPNAITVTLNTDFFGSENGYTLYSAEDSSTKVGYTTDYFVSAGEMQYNTSNNNGKACGIAVTTISPNYVIASIKINYSTPGSGLNVYKKNSAFAKPSSAASAISTTDATLVESEVKESKTIAIGAPAFAIIPCATGVIKVTDVEVTYAKKAADDGSVMFECESFVDQMINQDEMVEIELPEDAPTITYTSSNVEVANVEDGYIMAYKPGNAVITASWEAVAGKWMAGTEEFTIYVKYATLKDVLADAQDLSSGFVKGGAVYTGNFPLVVGSDHGSYTYVTDGTAWALFYDNKHTHAEGSVIEPGWSATVSEYHGLLEFTKISHNEITKTDGEYTIKAYDDKIVDESCINEVMVLNDVIFAEATPEGAGIIFTGTYNGQTINFNNMFEIATVVAGAYNVEGAVSIYDNDIRFFPTEYIAQEVTTAPVHADTKLSEGDEVVFTGVEEGAHVYYCLGKEAPDHTNVFTEAGASARRRIVPAAGKTYNHTTHPLTFNGEEMVVSYLAKAPGKAPSKHETVTISSQGVPTSIVEVSSVKDGKEVYDLQGRKVVAPVRGLYIVDGAKKFVR